MYIHTLNKLCFQKYMLTILSIPLQCFLVTTGCFTVAMDSGVRIFNVEPLAEHGRIGKKKLLTLTS